MKRIEKLKRHIRNKYYKEDKKIIKIRINNESELYNSLDFARETIANNITNYVESTAETLLPLSEITIAISSFEPCDLVKFKNAMNLYYGLKILNVKRYQKIERIKAGILVFSALVSLLMLTFAVEKTHAIASFVATLSIWQLTDMILFKDEEKHIKSYIYDILEDAKVIQDK